MRPVEEEEVREDLEDVRWVMEEDVLGVKLDLQRTLRKPSQNNSRVEYSPVQSSQSSQYSTSPEIPYSTRANGNRYERFRTFQSRPQSQNRTNSTSSAPLRRSATSPALFDTTRRISATTIPRSTSMLIPLPTNDEFRAGLMEHGNGGAIPRSNSAVKINAGATMTRTTSVVSIASGYTVMTPSMSSSSRFTMDTESTLRSREVSYESFQAGLTRRRGLSGSVAFDLKSTANFKTNSPAQQHTRIMPNQQKGVLTPSDSAIISSYPLQDRERSFGNDLDGSFEIDHPSFFSSADSSFHMDHQVGAIEIVGDFVGDMNVVEESEPSEDAFSGTECTDDEDKENKAVPRQRDPLTPIHETSVLAPVRYDAEADRSLRAARPLRPVVDDRSGSSLSGSRTFRRFSIGEAELAERDDGWVSGAGNVSKILLSEDTTRTARHLALPQPSPHHNSNHSFERAFREVSEEILYRPPIQYRTPSKDRNPSVPSNQSTSPGVIGSGRRQSREEFFSSQRSRPHILSPTPNRSFLGLAAHQLQFSSPVSMHSILPVSSSNPLLRSSSSAFSSPSPSPSRSVPGILLVPADQEHRMVGRDSDQHPAVWSDSRKSPLKERLPVDTTAFEEEHSMERGRRNPKPPPLGLYQAPSTRRPARRVSREPSPRLSIIEEQSSNHSGASGSSAQPPSSLRPSGTASDPSYASPSPIRRSIWTLSTKENIVINETASEPFPLTSVLLYLSSSTVREEEEKLPVWWHGYEDPGCNQLWDSIPNAEVDEEIQARSGISPFDRVIFAAEMNVVETEEIQAISNFCIVVHGREARNQTSQFEVPLELVSVFGRPRPVATVSAPIPYTPTVAGLQAVRQPTRQAQPGPPVAPPFNHSPHSSRIPLSTVPTRPYSAIPRQPPRFNTQPQLHPSAPMVTIRYQNHHQPAPGWANGRQSYVQHHQVQYQRLAPSIPIRQPTGPDGYIPSQPTQQPRRTSPSYIVPMRRGYQGP